ncbi:MAG: N-acetylglucosaminidase [Lachnospiraceae bacterium]|nr:N-acetylglucosaminidase [Lachnospiraceae bacterium]
MEVFKINLDDFDNWIKKYEELAEEVDRISGLANATAEISLNENVWMGEDADLFRTGINKLAGYDMPQFADYIRENVAIMRDSSQEFKACKKFCEEFINVFDEYSIISSSLEDMHGVLYCDYDAINTSVELCKNIEEEKYMMEQNIHHIQNELKNLHYPQPQLEEALCVLENKVKDLSRIEQHRHDLIKYASMVRAADDRLASRIVNILYSPSDNANIDTDYDECLKEKYWFLYDYLVDEKGLSNREALDYLRYLRDDKKTLSSYWATYNYSGSDYKKLIENIDCDLWTKEQMPFLTSYLDEKEIVLSDFEKNNILSEYYRRYYEPEFTMPSAGLASSIDDIRCEIDFDKCDEFLLGGSGGRDFEVVNYIECNYSVNELVDMEYGLTNPVQVEASMLRNKATKEELQYYIDPNNFIDDDIDKYQFLDLTSSAGLTKEQIGEYLIGKGILEGKEECFYNVAKKYGINEAYLIAHSSLETSGGTSPLATGYNYQLENGSMVIVYNMYGINAFDYDPEGEGAKFAYEQGWTTVEKAIEGGAEWIYIQYLEDGQNTLYEMRWNPELPTEHQYASDVGWAHKQAPMIKKAMDELPEAKLVFVVPRYSD